MKRTIQTLVFTMLLLISLVSKLSAQESSYKTAVGLRLGYPLSVSLKHFLGEKNAIEGFVGMRGYSSYRWITVGGLYQLHTPISGVNGLNWYWGGGAAAYFWSFKSSFLSDASSVSLGILGCVGLDYKVSTIPLSLSIDWVPSYSINGYGSGFGGGYGAISVRYTLK